MAGADVSADRPQKGKKHGVRRPKRRIGIRIDMTPMVDIAFLLLIFYMVTTVFSMPQAMEINLPPSDQKEELKIKESNVLTIHVDESNRFYWNIGRDLPVALRPDSLRAMLVKENQANASLNTLIIIHQKARYHTMVDILDEIDVIERSFNAATAKQMGVTLKEFNDPQNARYDEFRDKKFSYRYAIAPWEDRDTRIMEKVTSLSGGVK